MATPPQRAYRAACPNCGAPVEFASAASASAVCGFCRSTLVREGQALRRIGLSAELFDDHSPLQLGAGGTRQGVAFTLVGRLQYGYFTGPRASASPAPAPEGPAGPGGAAASEPGGTWNEWHALFDNGRSAWLSEDNGAYVMAFDAPLPRDAPADAQALAALRAGQRVQVDGRAWDVASLTRARLIAAQGELPQPPPPGTEFLVVDLRNSAGEVATLDASDPARLAWSVGRAVALSELALHGLKEASAKSIAARAFECPGCGAALEVKLASTQSLTCHQCKEVIDVSAGVGAEMAHYQQANAGDGGGAEPQIALGSSGKLALGSAELLWQAVGYQERCDVPDDADEETTFWREYLLYHRSEGFAFLVDSNDGWSWVRPLTGAPTVRGKRAQWQGTDYQLRWEYAARTTWVQGEFYWRVQQGEQARIADYEGQGRNAARRLSREQGAGEVTWSAGSTLEAAEVADAFHIAPSGRAALQRDAAPLALGAAGLGGVVKALLVLAVVLVLVVLLARCDNNDCDALRATFGAASNEYQQCLRGGTRRTGGGSYGGWSSGGGHK